MTDEESMPDWSESANCTCGAYDEGDGVWVRITDPFCRIHGGTS